MKPLLNLLLFAILISVSCKKKDSTPTTGEIKKNYRLKQMKIEFGATNPAHIVQYDFDYNEAGNLEKAYKVGSLSGDSSLTFTYEYDEQNRVIKEVKTGGHENLTISYAYTGNGDVQLKLTRDGNKEPFFLTYKLDKNNIVEFIRYEISSSTEILSIDKMHYDETNNLSQLEIQLHPSSFKPFIINTQFDDKPNYLHTLKGLINTYHLFYENPYLFSVSSANNLLKYTKVGGSTEYVCSQTFEYNQDGYPVKMKFENDKSTSPYDFGTVSMSYETY